MRNIIFYFFMLYLYGCASEPFQPVPPEFTMWMKDGASEETVKKAMSACGYPNAGGFAGVRSAIQEHARAQQCIFKSGYRHKDGSPGIYFDGHFIIADRKIFDAPIFFFENSINIFGWFVNRGAYFLCGIRENPIFSFHAV